MKNQRLIEAARAGACHYVNSIWYRLQTLPGSAIRETAAAMVQSAEQDIDLIASADILDDLGFDLTNYNRFAVTYVHPSNNLRIFLTKVNDHWEYRGSDDDPSHFRTYPVGTKFRQNICRRMDEYTARMEYFEKIDALLDGTPYERRGGYNVYHCITDEHVSVQITDDGVIFEEQS